MALRADTCVMVMRIVRHKSFEYVHRAPRSSGFRSLLCALQIEQFHPAFWPGPLYLDEDKAFYKALGDGTLVKGNKLDLLNPLSQAWKNVRAAKKNVKDHNLKGDGLTMGGHFVFNRSGEVVFKHVEKTFGDHPETSEVRFTTS